LEYRARYSIQQFEVLAAEGVQPPLNSMEHNIAKRGGEAKMSNFILNGKWQGCTPPPFPDK
jgi:hypothetical protein